jgi:hypothetical protein
MSPKSVTLQEIPILIIKFAPTLFPPVNDCEYLQMDQYAVQKWLLEN